MLASQTKTNNNLHQLLFLYFPARNKGCQHQTGGKCTFVIVFMPTPSQGSYRNEKYLKMKACLEKSLNR